MSAPVTTVKLVCCKSCGQVFGVEGWYNATPYCPVHPEGKHQILWVPVVVPLI